MPLIPIQLQILRKLSRAINSKRKDGKAMSQKRSNKCFDHYGYCRHYTGNIDGEIRVRTKISGGVTDVELLEARITVLKAKLSFSGYKWYKEEIIEQIARTQSKLARLIVNQ